MKTQALKGMRDLLPAEQTLRDYIQGKILETYRASGFERISTPMLEDMENLDKSDGGDNLNLIFKVLKRGDKLTAALNTGDPKQLSDMGLRYDLTLPLSRYYAANKDKLPNPFKVIQTDRVFRAERPQKGRLREFVQCDIDILGDSSPNAEVELIDVTTRALLNIGFTGFTVNINDRRILRGMLESMGFAADTLDSVCITFDKMDKIGADGVKAELVNVTYQNDWLNGEMRVTLPAAASARYAGEGGTASLLNDFTLYAQTDDGPKDAVAEDVRIEKNGEDTVLCQPFSLGIQIPTAQGFTVRFWAGELGPLLAEVTAEGAAASEITPWPSEGDNDPVSIDPTDYGIVYDTEHMPDWETCPLSYLCAYYLGADGAYAQGAMDTLAQRYRQAPNTVQNYLNTLAAKYAGVDRQLLSQIRLAAESLYGAENGTSADPLVGLLYNESFDYSDGVGNSGHYTYRVPQLLADTADARAINAAIADEYGPIVEETLDDRASGVSLSCLYVMWESYRCGDILSLVVSCGWSFDSNQYSVYLYDTARGVRLTTSELLTAQGVDETAFLNAVRQAAADTFDALYGQTGDAAAERRTWTLSDANINRDVPAYADAAGHLYAVLPIGSPAGADAYEQVLALDVGA